MTSAPIIRHATCVAIGGRGVLIEGASGSGKSDLALRLIDRGAALVADDATAITVTDGRVIADAPATIAGRMEVRGLGIVDMPAAGATPVALAVACDPAAVTRLPHARAITIGDVDIPWLAIDPRAASAPIAVELALRTLSA